MSVDSDDRISIQEALGPADLEDVRALLHAYAEEFSRTIGDNLRLQRFDEEVAGLPGSYAEPSGAILLARVDGRPAGCVAVRPLDDGVCEMKRLYVDASHRSLGLGGRLVAAILERATRLGHRRMILDASSEMGRAVALYRSFGFTETEPYGVSRGVLYFTRELDSPGSGVG